MAAELKTPKYPVLDEIEVPEKVIENWQITVDLLARIANIPAALVMRVHAGEIEVFLSSHSPGNVYHPREKAPLDTGLYCETVMSTQCELLVPNALKDPAWDSNPDLGLGMISYCGLPLTWPSNELFGTLCILDTKENAFSPRIRDLMERFRDSILLNLASIYETSLVRIQRDEAQIAMRESERRSQRYLDTMQTVMVALDTKGCVTMINRAGQTLLGYTEAELIGSNWFVTCVPHTDGSDALCPVFRRILAGELEGSAKCESSVLCRNGQRLIGWHNTPLRDEEGSIIGVLCSGEDITEYKRAQEKLLKSEQRYSRSIELTGLIGWKTRADGQIEDIPAWRNFTGQSLDEVKGWGWLNAIHPNDRKHVAQAWQTAVDTKSSYETEYRIRRHDGAYLHFIARGIPVEGLSGEIVEWVGVCIDITERKRAEQQLSALNEQLEGIVRDRTRELSRKTAFLEAQANSTIDGILVIDSEGKKIYQNRQFTELFKIPRENAEESIDISRIRWAKEQAKYPESFLQRVAWLYSHPDEIGQDEIELKDGTILDRYSAPVIGEEGIYYGRIWIFRDVTLRQEG